MRKQKIGWKYAISISSKSKENYGHRGEQNRAEIYYDLKKYSKLWKISDIVEIIVRIDYSTHERGRRDRQKKEKVRSKRRVSNVEGDCRKQGIRGVTACRRELRIRGGVCKGKRGRDGGGSCRSTRSASQRRLRCLPRRRSLCFFSSQLSIRRRRRNRRSAYSTLTPTPAAAGCCSTIAGITIYIMPGSVFAYSRFSGVSFILVRVIHFSPKLHRRNGTQRKEKIIRFNEMCVYGWLNQCSIDRKENVIDWRNSPLNRAILYLHFREGSDGIHQDF